jgi:hypothetical protein
MVSSVRRSDDIALKMEHVSVMKPGAQIAGLQGPGGFWHDNY